jgi:DNA-directed RNA polymerase specialized sigma24 family protein
MRSKRQIVFLVDIDIDPEEPATSAEDRTLAHELLDLLRRSTSPRNWHAWLRNAEGESIESIATSTGVAVGTVATRIRLARRDFAAAIQRERMSDLVLAVRRKRQP